MSDYPKAMANGFVFEDGEYLSFTNMMQLFKQFQIECIADPAYEQEGMWNLATPVYVSKQYTHLLTQAILEVKSAGNSGR